MPNQVMTQRVAYCEMLLLVCLPIDIQYWYISLAQASRLRHFGVLGKSMYDLLIHFCFINEYAISYFR